MSELNRILLENIQDAIMLVYNEKRGHVNLMVESEDGNVEINIKYVPMVNEKQNES